MVIDERDNRQERLEQAAHLILNAGRTAPKGKGIDNLEIILLTGDSVRALADATREAAKSTGMKFFLRDAENIEHAGVVILVGTRFQSMGLNCAYCGFPSCAAKLESPETPCTLNSIDLGIAIGSMTAMAADLRLDSRVMFSVGFSATRAGLLPGCHSVLAIPLSISSKNPFFDRISTR